MSAWSPQLSLSRLTNEEVVQQRIVTTMIVAMYAFLIGEALVTFVSVQLDDETAGLPLRLHALTYGPPLMFAAAAGWMRRGRGVRFWGSNTLDTLIRLLAAYWAIASVHGLFAGNDRGKWLSTTFTFAVAPLVYLALRTISDSRQLERLVRHMFLAATIALPLSLGATYYALVVRSYVGAGGIGYVLPVLAGATFIGRRSVVLGWLVIVTALVNNLFSMKRAIWGVLIAYPAVYAALSGVSLRRLAQLSALLAALGAVAYVGVDYLPQSANAAALADRAQSVEVETAGFSSGQAREDEIRSIWREIAAERDVAAVLFGRGLGATYNYYAESSTGELMPNYHNSHFTPAGWLLRGGIVGLSLNLSFYVYACVAVVVAARTRRASWMALLASYFILAVLVSATSFSLTPNPVTHVLLVAVLLRSATADVAPAEA